MKQEPVMSAKVGPICQRKGTDFQKMEHPIAIAEVQKIWIKVLGVGGALEIQIGNTVNVLILIQEVG